MDTDYDIIIIGAGPGGYVAAIRAAQLGLTTAIVERDYVGGLCLNWGCIPSKALLKNAEILSLLKKSEEFGFSFEGLTVDFGKAIDRSRKVVDRITKGVHHLLAKNKIEVIEGEAFFRTDGSVEIIATGQVIRSKNTIISTGSRPRNIPVLPVDGVKIINSREALEERNLPDTIAIIGAGATGMEFAYIYSSYGVKVTVIEMQDSVIPNEDTDISKYLEKVLANQGIEFIVGTKVTGVIQSDIGSTLQLESDIGQKQISVDKILVSVGVEANSDMIGLDNIGVSTCNGFIEIDDYMRTNISGVYAIGDVTGKLPLAHVASAQGVAAVENIAGLEIRPLDYQNIPRAIYCNPQVASLGLTEIQAREAGYNVGIGKFPFQAVGKAVAIDEMEGLVKFVVDLESGAIIGAHMVGPEVTEMLGEISMAQMLECTTKELGFMIHAHPTLSEVIKEAALATDNQAIHI